MKKWSAQDIEIFKAGIMKYGMNKWSKISSLLNKPENECKEQFYKTITYKDNNLRDLRDNRKDSNNRKDVRDCNNMKDNNNIKDKKDRNNINDIKDNDNINISLEERVIIEEMKNKNINNNVIAQYIGKNRIIVEEYLNHIKYDNNKDNNNMDNKDNNINDHNNIDSNIDNNIFNYMDMIKARLANKKNRKQLRKEKLLERSKRRTYKKYYYNNDTNNDTNINNKNDNNDIDINIIEKYKEYVNKRNNKRYKVNDRDNIININKNNNRSNTTNKNNTINTNDINIIGNNIDVKNTKDIKIIYPIIYNEEREGIENKDILEFIKKYKEL